MYRETQDALERHQSSMAAAKQIWRQELAAVQEEFEAKVAALQAAHHAALQGAHAEVAAVTEQAAAALASRPEQEQYIQVRFFPGSIIQHAACTCSCTPLQTLQSFYMLADPSGKYSRSPGLHSWLICTV